MRVLLDNNMPHELRHHFGEPGGAARVDVMTAKYRGWDTLRNGQLLREAQREFDVMVTLDRGFATEQKIANFNIAVILLRPSSSDIDDILPLVNEAAKLLTTCRPGRLYVIEPEEGEEPRSG